MKLQYLGDSKDCFKWDYHDYMMTALEFPKLSMLLMLTLDDRSGEGETHPTRYPAREGFVEYCHRLKRGRNLELLAELPNVSLANYVVEVYNPPIPFSNTARWSYFSGVPVDGTRMYFLDPDNGFEPEKSCSEKHVKFTDIELLLERMSDDSVISVFHHFRRKSFPADFAAIRARLKGGFATAVYWQHLMFVFIAKTEQAIVAVRVANAAYARTHPVKMLP